MYALTRHGLGPDELAEFSRYLNINAALGQQLLITKVIGELSAH
jgi:hypothetical protein